MEFKAALPRSLTINRKKKGAGRRERTTKMMRQRSQWKQETWKIKESGKYCWRKRLLISL